MNIVLYKNSAPPNKVDKSSNLSNALTIEDVIFTERNTLDMLNPSVLIKYTNDIDDIRPFNYMKIGQFSRYYYVDSISAENGLIRINGRCDVLMSHKTDILNSKQYITRQQNKNTSTYLDDNMLPIRSDHYYKTTPIGDPVFDKTCGRVILATTGKGGTLI